MDMGLPGAQALRDRVPSDLTLIQEAELTGATQEVRFDGATRRICTPDGDCNTQCQNGPDCKLRFTLNERVFMPADAPHILKLGQASRWTLRGDRAWQHPFHIHVNPFEVERDEPGPDGQMIKAKLWKDTIIVPSRMTTLASRYTKFDGEFVIHCHILGHEDMGMMQRIKITR